MPQSKLTEQAHLERILGRAWNSLPLAAMIVDHKGVVRFCNDQIRYLLGYEPDQLTGTSMDHLVVQAEGREESPRSDEGEIPSEKVGGALEFYTPHQNGSMVPVHLSLTQVDEREYSGEVWTLVIMQDRRSHRGSGGASGNVAERYRQLFDQNQVGLIWARLGGEILSCNPAAARMFGYETPEAFEGESFDDHFRGDPEERQRTIERLQEEGEISEWNVPVKRQDGSPFVTLESLLLQDDSDHRPVVVSRFVEITEQARLWEQLKEMAYHDPLTGLPNRRFFQEQAKKAFALADRRERHAGVAYIDLDNFKAANDQWGHETGDEILVTIGERAERAIRESDVVARIGGDEFVVLWVDLDDPHEAQLATRRVVQSFEEAFQIGDKQFSLTVSAGVATFPSDGETVETLLHQADQAMYRAKNEKENGLAVSMADPESN